ncbi:hypothetical protein DOY81_010210, partial [Sarcophaga bullata]
IVLAALTFTAAQSYKKITKVLFTIFAEINLKQLKANLLKFFKQ